MAKRRARRAPDYWQRASFTSSLSTYFDKGIRDPSRAEHRLMFLCGFLLFRTWTSLDTWLTQSLSCRANPLFANSKKVFFIPEIKIPFCPFWPLLCGEQPKLPDRSRFCVLFPTARSAHANSYPQPLSLRGLFWWPTVFPKYFFYPYFFSQPPQPHLAMRLALC